MKSLVGEEDRAWLEGQARSSPAGALVEVGVYQGGSARNLYKVALEQGRKIFLYDTFYGIPYHDPEIDSHKTGDFADTTWREVMQTFPLAYVVNGIFPRTYIPTKIALAHIDVDQYKSTKDAIAMLWPDIVPGGMMVFDDYGLLPSATRAIDEQFKSLRRDGLFKYYVKKGEDGGLAS